MEISLSARPPFSLFSVVRSHGWVRLAPFEWNEEWDGFDYVIRLESGKVVNLKVEEAPGGVVVETTDDLLEVERQEVERVVTWMLGLDLDFGGFYQLARQEPKLSGVIERARGRILRSSSLFEDTVKTILTTNTAWGGTIRMVEAVVAQFGAPMQSDPTKHAFPTPEQLAVSNEDTLRGETRLGYRAPYVLELAQTISSGELDLESLKTTGLSTPELHKELLAIKGVGGYAAANLLMILGRYDFLPIDSWAMKVVSHEWYNGGPVGRTEVEAAFEDWGEWKGLAYWFWDWSLLSEG